MDAVAVQESPAALPGRPWRLRPALRVLSMLLVVGSLALSQRAMACGNPGDWLWEGQEILSTARMMDRIEPGSVLLLGERHGSAQDHYWQSQVLAALVGRFDNLAVGYEMFDREQQAILRQWRNDELSEETFLEAVGWGENWGYPAELYMPLFRINRMYALPMVALNVDSDLVRRIGSDGWDAVPEDERHGITPAADASEPYRDWLRTIYDRHPQGEVADAAGFEGFVRAQLVWDRAMAEALYESSGSDKVVVGVVGRGHVRHGHGIAHQLEDLGHEQVVTMLPLDSEAFCEARDDPPAQVVFRLPEQLE